RFDAYRWDAETGFYQVRYRYLHPTLGRWVSRDLLQTSTHSNLMVFSNNNSATYLDDLGLYAFIGTTILPNCNGCRCRGD
ncbi:MAG: hypothetical protein EBT61_22845, partial [Verrucomicrobia bacterium]|nr:hypothetical protein [Verrucomicrobiota bacterium]